MAFFKKKITEQEAATQFVLSALRETRNAWPTIYKTLRELHGDKFVDAEGIAYAICAYKKGEPQYSLVANRLWERMEDVEKIMGNPGLSAEEQQQEIRKLIEK